MSSNDWGRIFHAMGYTMLGVSMGMPGLQLWLSGAAGVSIAIGMRLMVERRAAK